MRKNVRQTILKSLGRYIAIVAIIALGAGMFVGLLSTKMDMVATAQKYVDEQNMFDLRLLSTYGWSAEDVDKIARLNGIVDAEGSITLDVFAQNGFSDQESVYRLHSIPQKVNKVYLLGGRMPVRADECLVDGFHLDDSVLGTKFTISDTNDEATLETLNERTFTVVGYVNSPLYMDMSRGNTTLGSGSLASFVYLPEEAFHVDYYTEIDVTIEGDYEVYTEAFTKAMEEIADAINGDVTVLAQERLVGLKADAELEYADGLKEYEDGLAEYEKGKQEALDKLADGLKELEDGQAELDKNWTDVLDGEKQIADAEKTLEDNALLLTESKQHLADAKAEAYEQLAQAYADLMQNYKDVSSALKQVEDGLAQIEEGIPQLEDGLAQIESGLKQLDLVVGVLETSMDVTERLIELEKNSLVPNQDRLSRLEDQLASQQVQYDDYSAQRQELLDMQTEYTAQLAELKKTHTELKATKATLEEAMDQINLGFKELENQQLQAQNKFAAAEAELESGEIQLEAGRRELEAKEMELADGRKALEEAQAELDKGWQDYEKGKLEAETELAEAEAKLNDAKQQLDDARVQLYAMTEAEVFILDRNTNVGYLAVDSNSDIVAGVSRVFPAFFLLVAALVCITTMTRMVDEERTQIGILKALGYSNRAIVNKYLVYSGSAAVVGCGLGVLAGSVVFPITLWGAYSIILSLTPDIVLKLNWPLCLAVVAAYTVVSMLATWYCCRRELREVPAELMRPKAPTAGKKIWMEHLPFWNKISFLNKVMFRNVFRYRQRMLMMLVGIGGCTALLLTGFGFRDSIMDIVDYQFAEVTVYDMSVYFAEGQTELEQVYFQETLQGDVDKIHFFHQASVELDHNEKTHEIYMMVSDAGIKEHMDFHRGNEPMDMPGVGETYLTIGVAEAMGISVGDTITLRNSDMQQLSLKVTGIFDNHVQNFAIVLPQTIEEQWGETPASQMAYVKVSEKQDAHGAGAKISQMEDVMNVSISQDLADQVGSMLDALNLVVLTIVVCAGMLAVIVLYNLTNISITERIREIATIKVLGFNSKESAAYVFKENLLLTAMGSVVGLVGGIFLLKFVMSQIKIDMVWFTDRLTWMSFVWAVVLTMLSACFVDFLLYFKLEKINMAEALKSVE